MKVCIIGGNSGIAKHVIKVFRSFDIDLLIITRKNFPNYTHSLNDLFKIIKKNKIRFVFNFCAITSNNDCIKDPLTTIYINTIFPDKLSKFCNQIKINFVNFSTDHVFSSKKAKLFKVNEKKSPISFYGYSKSISEDLMKNDKFSNVIRLPMVFGSKMKKSFVTKHTKLLALNNNVEILSDKFFSPINADDIGFFLYNYYFKNSSLKEKFKVIHLSSNELISRYEFMKKIANLLDKEKYLKSIKTVNFKLEIPNAGLFCSEKKFKNSNLEKFVNDLSFVNSFVNK